MNPHIVQSPQWGEFKTKYGTPAIRVGDVQYTIHKIPKTNFKYAHGAKVDPTKIQWEPLIKSAQEKGVFVLNFDAPNVLKGTPDEQEALKIFSEVKAVKQPRNTFRKNSVLIDLTKSEDELFRNMNSRHRYGVRFAEKKGVTAKVTNEKEDLETFFINLQTIASEQNFGIHPKSYYQTLWEMLKPNNMVHILNAQFESEIVASWMLLSDSKTLYFPYGGSIAKARDLQANTLLGWEAIKLGKKLGCTLFDMWGACKDMNDKSDPEWGYSYFKLKFGGEHVEYMDSYDYVLNPTIYHAFNFVYPKVLEAVRLKNKLLK